MSEETGSSKTAKGIGLFGLIGLVVSSCIGTGVFALTGQLASVASPGGILISWFVVGLGFLCLAFSLNNLMVKRPDVNNVYAYATEGFGPFTGFLSGWGYWFSAWCGNIAFATVLASTLGYFIPYFLPGNNIGSILMGSVVTWLLVLLVIRGIESASFLNALIMIIKVAALVMFCVFGIALFNAGIFTADFWGNIHDAAVAAGSTGKDAVSFGSVANQITNCLITMMWVFIGIEGASVVTKRARKREQAGVATIIGLLIVLVVYLGVSLLPYGYMSYIEVAKQPYPALLYVFEQMAPGWGGAFISIAMLISGFGCWLSFTLLPAEVTKDMASDKLLGGWWGQLNKNNAPAHSLIVVGLCAQIFLITLLFSGDAYNFALSMCTITIAITWFLAAAYQVKLSYQRHETGQLVVGLIAAAFIAYGTIISGWSYLLLSCLGYIPGIIFYVLGRKEQNLSSFTKRDYLLIAGICVGAVAAVALLLVGIITI